MSFSVSGSFFHLLFWTRLIKNWLGKQNTILLKTLPGNSSLYLYKKIELLYEAYPYSVKNKNLSAHSFFCCFICHFVKYMYIKMRIVKMAIHGLKYVWYIIWSFLWIVLSSSLSSTIILHQLTFHISVCYLCSKQTKCGRHLT